MCPTVTLASHVSCVLLIIHHVLLRSQGGGVAGDDPNGISKSPKSMDTVSADDRPSPMTTVISTAANPVGTAQSEGPDAKGNGEAVGNPGSTNAGDVTPGGPGGPNGGAVDLGATRGPPVGRFPKETAIPMVDQWSTLSLARCLQAPSWFSVTSFRQGTLVCSCNEILWSQMDCVYELCSNMFMLI